MTASSPYRRSDALDLSPARWIWLPSQRTLANTFVLFRRTIHVGQGLRQATGWILADSRYLLRLDGKRMMWGPAPSDPRWPDADPLDLTRDLQAGEHSIAVEVLYYGHGDGTWVTGKPGLLFKLHLVYEDGSEELVVSDSSWQCRVDRAHRPGQYKRWYLRSLQEEFDARAHPYGWDRFRDADDGGWLQAMELEGSARKPAVCTSYTDYLYDSWGGGEPSAAIHPRQIPLLEEHPVPAERLAKAARVTWKRNPEDWFDFRVPDSFEIERDDPLAERVGNQAWRLPAGREGTGHLLTFEWKEQLVGFPFFRIEAPEGTIVELITQESHDPDRADWLDTHKFSWSRFICKEGGNDFECFDFESLRWLQLHIRNHTRPVQVSRVAVRRRSYPWPNSPRVICGEASLQRLFGACLNTMRNNAMETVVDGMGRERQQYSGDIGHELHAIRYACGDIALPERFLRTWSQGLTLEGYFIDCWPAYDRIVRIPQRQVGLTVWGPILDHGVQFVFDNWHHYMETGRTDYLDETYPRLKQFARYLESIRGEDGLLPVENIGVPSVWIDHLGYHRQAHKQCAFNLYVVGMLRHAMVPLARLRRDEEEADRCGSFADALLERTVERFWDDDQGLFVVNLPWLGEEREPRLCERSLALSLLYDLCPGNRTEPALQALADCPASLGRAYPPNAGWRHRALAKMDRTDVIVREWRERWAEMVSVRLNNTMSEDWEAIPDSDSQWSHASVAPLYVLMMDVIGLAPTQPGFRECRLRPRLADLPSLDVTMYTVSGAIRFRSEYKGAGHDIRVELPHGMKLETDLEPHDRIELVRVNAGRKPDKTRE